MGCFVPSIITMDYNNRYALFIDLITTVQTLHSIISEDYSFRLCHCIFIITMDYNNRMFFLEVAAEDPSALYAQVDKPKKESDPGRSSLYVLSPVRAIFLFILYDRNGKNAHTTFHRLTAQTSNKRTPLFSENF